MPNMAKKIGAQNRKVLQKYQDLSTSSNVTPLCNCRDPQSCPLDGLCRTKSVVYQATVNKGDIETQEGYIGLSGGEFKTRFTQHKSSFKNRSKKDSTALSQYIWELKEKGINYSIEWKILCQAPTYHPGSGRCLLCLSEKFYIMFYNEMASLNKRSEVSNTCRHKHKFLLG